MALFIVMWAISAVNTSKFAALKASLHAALGGKVSGTDKAILTGGRSVLNTNTSVVPGAYVAARTPGTGTGSTAATVAQNTSALAKVQQTVNTYAAEHGISNSLQTIPTEQGLVIRLLADKLLFAPGSAVLRPAGIPIVNEVATLLRTELPNAIRVEGNTDSQPISTAQFHSNWELSAARAAAILEQLNTAGVAASRLSLTGYADQRPVASNATPAGRSANRRVDIVVLRPN